MSKQKSTLAKGEPRPVGPHQWPKHFQTPRLVNDLACVCTQTIILQRSRSLQRCKSRKRIHHLRQQSQRSRSCRIAACASESDHLSPTTQPNPRLRTADSAIAFNGTHSNAPLRWRVADNRCGVDGRAAAWRARASHLERNGALAPRPLCGLKLEPAPGSHNDCQTTPVATASKPP